MGIAKFLNQINMKNVLNLPFLGVLGVIIDVAQESHPNNENGFT